jgi:hypothetical protein
VLYRFERDFLPIGISFAVVQVASCPGRFLSLAGRGSWLFSVPAYAGSGLPNSPLWQPSPSSLRHCAGVAGGFRADRVPQLKPLLEAACSCEVKTPSLKCGVHNIRTRVVVIHPLTPKCSCARLLETRSLVLCEHAVFAQRSHE